jgi:NadR type nicotinamide-nucleotide adenylyltransferase
MEPIARTGLARIVLTGPESVGKTTLAARLAAHFGVAWVPEFARGYAEAKGAPLHVGDVAPIAKGQVALEDAHIARADRLLVHDTDLVSTVVYGHHYFGHCPADVEAAARARRASRYLLLDTDVPWVPDGVRDRGDRREELFALFSDTLARLEADVVVVRGDWEARFAAAVAATVEVVHAARPGERHRTGTTTLGAPPATGQSSGAAPSSGTNSTDAASRSAGARS